MIERFTVRARQVIVVALNEARRLRHGFVGTEHVLLGLVLDGEGALPRLGPRLKAEVEHVLAGFPTTLTFEEVLFTPQAKRVLELSIEEAQHRHIRVGTEDLLSGLIKEGQSVAAKILESFGVRLDAVQHETVALLVGDLTQPTRESKLDPVIDLEQRSIPFIGRARRTISLAREEARRFRHGFVGPEHVLLGAIRDVEGVAVTVLQRLGLRLETVRAEVERALAGYPQTPTFGVVPFTPQARRVLELALEEARYLSHLHIGGEHLLLGLMREGQSIAAKILESLGARLDEVRQEIRLRPMRERRAETPTPDRFPENHLPPAMKDFPIFDGHPQMRAIRSIIDSIAHADATVLIRGESGVGKDLVARAIHAASTRRDGPFIKVNCAAIPGELLESELFGYEKGAFTGAHRRKLGQLEYADKGSIYLDEIAELPLTLQVKLLQALQDFRFSRLGGAGLIDLDVRVIAATSRDLEEAMTHGKFREDLYYRLNVVEIRVPPLRERREEIPALVSWFLAKFTAQYGRPKQISPETMARLIEYPWPGNIRELENTVRRLVVLTDSEQAFEAQCARAQGTKTVSGVPGAPPAPFVTESLREIARRGAREAERKALAEVLEHVRWNLAEASRILKVNSMTLLNKIAECGLKEDRQRLTWLGALLGSLELFRGRVAIVLADVLERIRRYRRRQRP